MFGDLDNALAAASRIITPVQIQFEQHDRMFKSKKQGLNMSTTTTSSDIELMFESFVTGVKNDYKACLQLLSLTSQTVLIHR